MITPTLGSSPWLEETVASVAMHAAGAVHVLVAPCEQMEGLQTKFPGVHLVAEPGGGMYAAINAGLATAGAWDAFTYINDDDTLLPGFEAVMKAARENPQAVVYGEVELVDEQGRSLGRNPVSRFLVWNRLLHRAGIEAVCQQGTIITRTAWDNTGPFDASYRFCGDSEWLARASARGCAYVFCGVRVATFRLRKNQMSRNEEAMRSEARRFVLGLGPRPPWWLRLPAVFAFRLGNIPVYVERVCRHGWMRARTQQTTS